jgi:hypothetical protein
MFWKEIMKPTFFEIIPSLSLTSIKESVCLLFVCLFFIHFYTVAPISVKFGMKMENIPGEKLGY